MGLLRTENICSFIGCNKIRDLFHFFKNLIYKLFHINNVNIDTLHFNFNLSNSRSRNSAILLISEYIATIWFNRDVNAHIDVNMYKVRVLRQRQIISIILKDKLGDIFSTAICEANKIFDPD